MTVFLSEYVGGPLCGMKVRSPIAPREGDARCIEVEDYVHRYEWRKFAHMPPAWRYIASRPRRTTPGENR